MAAAARLRARKIGDRRACRTGQGKTQHSTSNEYRVSGIFHLNNRFERVSMYQENPLSILVRELLLAAPTQFDLIDHSGHRGVRMSSSGGAPQSRSGF